MTNMACNYRSTWSDSGDRGADMADHNRSCHPNHTHVWGPSTYAWEQAGEFYMPDGMDFRTWEALCKEGKRPVRTETPIRCEVCSIAPRDVRVCA